MVLVSFWRSKDGLQAQKVKTEFKEAGAEIVSQSVKCLPCYWFCFFLGGGSTGAFVLMFYLSLPNWMTSRPPWVLFISFGDIKVPTFVSFLLYRHDGTPPSLPPPSHLRSPPQTPPLPHTLSHWSSSESLPFIACDTRWSPCHQFWLFILCSSPHRALIMPSPNGRGKGLAGL